MAIAVQSLQCTRDARKFHAVKKTCQYCGGCDGCSCIACRNDDAQTSSANSRPVLLPPLQISMQSMVRGGLIP